MRNIDESLEELWASVPAATHVFEPKNVRHLPDTAQRYLCHAIAPYSRLASAVRLQMHGHLRLEKAWLPFRAEQVISANRGFVWRAKVKMKGLFATGFDQWIDGAGAAQWKFLGLFPMMKAAGADISRSALGRFNGEAIWLPTRLLNHNVEWIDDGTYIASAVVQAYGEKTRLEISTESNGSLRKCKFQRWGNFKSEKFGHQLFGAYIDQEKTFDGYTIPTQIRAGWFFGTSRFVDEGEFFRCTIDNAVFR